MIEKSCDIMSSKASNCFCSKVFRRKGGRREGKGEGGGEEGKKRKAIHMVGWFSNLYFVLPYISELSMFFPLESSLFVHFNTMMHQDELLISP